MPARHLETTRLSLRPFTAAAVDALIAGDPARLRAAIGASFPEPLRAPPLMDDALGWVREADLAGSPWPTWLGVERAANVVVCAGGISPRSDDPSVFTLGYAAYPEFERRGYVTEFAGALLEWVFDDHEAAAVEATIPPWNTASIRVAEKLGMRVAGTAVDDEVGDVLVFRVDRAGTAARRATGTPAPGS